MTKLEEKLIQLGYCPSTIAEGLYYKCFKCTIFICLTKDKKQIQKTLIDYKVLTATRADGILAETLLQKDLKELELCQ